MKRRLIFKILRWILFSVVGLVVLVALLIVEENWRGKRAWEQCKSDLEARGEHLDLKYFIPPPVPDDQNFAMAPLLKPLFDFKCDPKTGEIVWRDLNPPVKKISVYAYDPATDEDNAKIRKLGIEKYIAESLKKPLTAVEQARPRQKEGWQTGNFRDLQEWQAYYRLAFPDWNHPRAPAEDVLATLDRSDALYLELRDTVKTRPFSRMPYPDSEGPEEAAGEISYYSTVQELARVAALRAIAELRLSRPDEAFADLQFGLRLQQDIRNRPVLIESLLGNSLVAILMQPVWEGIAAHQWTDAQLVALQKILKDADCLSYAASCMHGEMAWTVARTNYILSGRGYFPVSEDVLVSPWLQLAKLYPGFFYQNQIAVCRTIEDKVLPLIDLKSRDIDSVRLLQERNASKEKRLFSPYTLFARLALPVYFSVLEKCEPPQTWLNQAIIACAIERHRFAHGALPATLDDLHMAADLPHDVINGQSLHYRVIGDDNYILYSVGWNGTDDGGKVVKESSGRIDMKQGDWVWSLKPL